MKDLYAGQAELFEKFSELSYPWRFIERPALNATVLPLLRPDTKILDAGCGSGRVLRYLIEHGVNPSNITGIDTSNSMLSIARAKSPKVTYKLADIARPPSIKKSSFGMVISVHVFPHLDSKQLNNTMQNFWDVLEFGGCLIYLVGHPDRYLRDLGAKGGQYSRTWRKQITPWGTYIDHFYRIVDDYVTATTRAGFFLSSVQTLKPIDTGKEDYTNYRRHTKYASRLLVHAVKLKSPPTGLLSGSTHLATEPLMTLQLS